MADISSYLQKILEAIYGEEVRGSIHDALAAMNVESNKAMEFASTAKDSAQASAALARDSADTAITKANEVVESANAAKLSETNARDAETNAVQKAAEAAVSEAAAKLSETNAASSEATAIQKASEAEAAKSAAAASAETAKQYSGKPPKPQDGTWWVWDATQQKYVDTGIACDLVGPTGNGIDSFVLTSGDHMPGSTDVYTVTMTDGSTKEISVYNGKNGTGIGDVMGIAFDIEIPASGWINGKVTISDSRFIASARYKYFIDTYDECRDEVKESVIRPQDIKANGYLTFTSEFTPLTDVTVNILRVEVNGSGNTP